LTSVSIDLIGLAQVSRPMDFALTSEQEMIRATAETFLADASPSAAVRRAMETEIGFDADVWNQVGKEFGWCAIAIPETFGGLGLTIIEQAILMEQMGRRLFCSPYFATACLAVPALLEVGTAAAREGHLPSIAAGEITATLAFGERGLDWDIDAVTATATPVAGGYSISGHFQHVPDGASAQLLLLPARIVGRDQVSLFAIPAATQGITTQPSMTIDATRRIAEVRLCELHAGENAIVSMPGNIGNGLARTSALAAIALAAEQLGAAQQCPDALQTRAVSPRHQNQFLRQGRGLANDKHLDARVRLRKDHGLGLPLPLRRGGCSTAWGRGIYLGIRSSSVFEASPGQRPVAGQLRLAPRAGSGDSA
jgi:alkylation response protein AidB-like acyl-CoA dehydrogenase